MWSALRFHVFICCQKKRKENVRKSIFHVLIPKFVVRRPFLVCMLTFSPLHLFTLCTPYASGRWHFSVVQCLVSMAIRDQHMFFCLSGIWPGLGRGSLCNLCRHAFRPGTPCMLNSFCFKPRRKVTSCKKSLTSCVWGQRWNRLVVIVNSVSIRFTAYKLSLLVRKACDRQQDEKYWLRLLIGLTASCFQFFLMYIKT